MSHDPRFSTIIPSPIGNLGIHIHNNKLTRIVFLGTDQSSQLSNENEYQPLHNELTAYFQNPQHDFQFPLEVKGTPFQKTVWQALRQIPVSTTISYQELATHLGTSPRAIGNACRANPTPIIVPCHRVVAKNHMGGFVGKTAGEMIAIKRWLLTHEKVV